MLQKHYIIDDSMNVFIDDNSTTKINLFTNICHKPLNFLFVNKYYKKNLNLISSITSDKTLFSNILLNNKKQ